MYFVSLLANLITLKYMWTKSYKKESPHMKFCILGQVTICVKLHYHRLLWQNEKGKNQKWFKRMNDIIYIYYITHYIILCVLLIRYQYFPPKYHVYSVIFNIIMSKHPLQPHIKSKSKKANGESSWSALRPPDPSPHSSVCPVCRLFSYD